MMDYDDIVKIALDPSTRDFLSKGFLAAAVPQAYAAARAPEGHRLETMGEAAKGTLLAGIPATAFLGRGPWAPSIAAGGGLQAVESKLQELRGQQASAKMNAIIEAMGKKIVPYRTRRQIEQEHGQ